MTELVRCPVCHENVGRHLGCARVIVGLDQPADCVLVGPLERAPNRDAAGRFGPGNKAAVGRNGQLPLRALAREATPEAFAKLLAVMRGTDDALALRAAEQVFDRAYGRPPQAIVGDDDAPPVRVDGLTRLDERCLALVRELLHLDSAEEPGT